MNSVGISLSVNPSGYRSDEGFPQLHNLPSAMAQLPHMPHPKPCYAAPRQNSPVNSGRVKQEHMLEMNQWVAFPKEYSECGIAVAKKSGYANTNAFWCGTFASAGRNPGPCHDTV